jgi:hypothetical protein
MALRRNKYTVGDKVQLNRKEEEKKVYMVKLVMYIEQDDFHSYLLDDPKLKWVPEKELALA